MGFGPWKTIYIRNPIGNPSHFRRVPLDWLSRRGSKSGMIWFGGSKVPVAPTSHKTTTGGQSTSQAGFPKFYTPDLTSSKNTALYTNISVPIFTNPIAYTNFYGITDIDPSQSWTEFLFEDTLFENSDPWSGGFTGSPIDTAIKELNNAWTDPSYNGVSFADEHNIFLELFGD